VHRGKKGCLLPKPQERVDSISNSHASRTLPLPLRPGSQSGRRLAFVFILDYRLDCGSANSACRVRPTLAAHRPQTKTAQEKNDAAPKRVGSTSPTFEERSNKNSKFAHPSASKVLEAPRSPLHLILTHHDISYSRYPPRNPVAYLGHTFRRLLPHRNVTNRGTANLSRPRRVAALPSQLQPAISPQLLGLEWLTKRYCRC